MGVAEGWQFDHMDVSIEFLYAHLKDETFVRIPERVTRVDGRVWKILKCLYGFEAVPSDVELDYSQNFGGERICTF